LLTMLLCWPAAANEPLRIAVAANFRSTLDQINEPYSRQTGQQILLSTASTGVLANQVLHGAPFDLLFAADEETPAQLMREGSGLRTQCYALGQLVLVGGELDAPGTADLSIAIANPATAPYGRAAMDVLGRGEFAGIKTIVRGTNVLQAYQFWLAGAADLALVARALAPEATPIPAQWHRSLEQHLVVLKESSPVRAYLQWLGSDTVRQMISNAGYLLCP
jgi:molybdate transport system substrate-binding protein